MVESVAPGNNHRTASCCSQYLPPPRPRRDSARLRTHARTGSARQDIALPGIEVAGGNTSDWVDVGSLINTQQHGTWNLPCGNYSVVFGIKDQPFNRSDDTIIPLGASLPMLPGQWLRVPHVCHAAVRTYASGRRRSGCPRRARWQLSRALRRASAALRFSNRLGRECSDDPPRPPLRRRLLRNHALFRRAGPRPRPAPHSHAALCACARK
eukprot:SAG11_NODE_1307_length_5243_cov_2.389774_4_plen_211_part_00